MALFRKVMIKFKKNLHLFMILKILLQCCLKLIMHARVVPRSRDGACLENFKLVNYRVFLSFEIFWDEQECNNY